jgi:hypothetical protein
MTRGAQNPDCQVASVNKFYVVATYVLWVLPVELALHHPSGT